MNAGTLAAAAANLAPLEATVTVGRGRATTAAAATYGSRGTAYCETCGEASPEHGRGADCRVCGSSGECALQDTLVAVVADVSRATGLTGTTNCGRAWATA